MMWVVTIPINESRYIYYSAIALPAFLLVLKHLQGFFYRIYSKSGIQNIYVHEYHPWTPTI